MALLVPPTAGIPKPDIGAHDHNHAHKDNDTEVRMIYNIVKYFPA